MSVKIVCPYNRMVDALNAAALPRECSVYCWPGCLLDSRVMVLCFDWGHVWQAVDNLDMDAGADSARAHCASPTCCLTTTLSSLLPA